MWLFPVFALCLAATACVDLAVALFRLTRNELFWPSAFCISLSGASAALMAIIFLDFDASTALYTTLAALGATALGSLLPAVRAMA